MLSLRSNWPDISITPKLHMVEDHILPFLSRWRVGCGFLGEQGGESIHSRMNIMGKRYDNIRNRAKRLEYLMNCHLSQVNPESRANKVAKKKRTFKNK